MYTRSIFCLILLDTLRADMLETYQKDRDTLIEEEVYQSVGGRLVLTQDESVANDILMRWKNEEMEFAFQNPHQFNFSRNYFEYRDQIKDSKVYQIIRKMPKGAVLHVHSTLMMDAEYMLNVTYQDNLYACPVWGNFKLQFSASVPLQPCPIKWELMSDLRNASKDLAQFDAEIKNLFMLDYKQDDNTRSSWDKFNRVVSNTQSLLKFRGVREKFLYDALKKFYDDNILYVEIRSSLSVLYELDGSKHERLYLARLYRDVTRKFVKDHPDFIGAKLIVTKSRSRGIDKVKESIEDALRVKEEMPDFFAGYDIVGEEDSGPPLSDFVPLLAEVKDKMNFYFHGGETNWYGMSTDENLIDGILLGTKRIGHGYALMKHPSLVEVVRKRDIAIEVNLVSNIVLSLVRDVRNHPLSLYLAMGLPVVISSDDPGVWGADPLSHDFFLTFMVSASRRADLRTLKQLAINSIRYSALNDRKKVSAFRLFNRKWEQFIKELITSETSEPSTSSPFETPALDIEIDVNI